MQITEIYKSIQGESTYAGLPCIFVRLTGCNLRCSWCDSEYTFTGGHRKTLEEVVEEVEQLSPDGGLVEITGGTTCTSGLTPFCSRPRLAKRQAARGIRPLACSIRNNSPTGCWRTASQPDWVCKFISSYGTRR